VWEKDEPQGQFHIDHTNMFFLAHNHGRGKNHVMFELVHVVVVVVVVVVDET
jgi:hypothetical protein